MDFVRRALSLTLDYTPETLPLLDHYLGTVPQDQPDTVRLVASTAGAYFGEVVRKAIGGHWEDREDLAPIDWKLRLAGDVAICPGGMAALAVLQAESEGVDGEYDVPSASQPLVEDALASRGRVAEDEFYSLSGRLEVLRWIIDIVLGGANLRAKEPEDPDADDGEPS